MDEYEIEETKKRFEFTAPCFSNTFPHRQRSMKRINCKEVTIDKKKKRINCKEVTINSQKKKLNTAEFEWYFG